MMVMAKVKVAAVVMVLAMAGVVVGKPTVPELLERYEANRSHLKSVAISSSSWRKSEDGATGVQWTHRTEEFRRDDQGRLQIITKSWVKLKTRDEQTVPDRAYTKEMVWDGKISYIYDAYGPALGVPAAANRVHLSKDAKELPNSYSGVYAGAVLDGVFMGDLEPLHDILQQGETHVRDTTDVVNGVACHVLDSKSAHGKYTIWMDPDHGYNIVKAEVQKSVGDPFNGVTMSAGPSSAAKDYPGFQGGRVIAFTLSLTNVRLEKQGEAWVPMAADYIATYRTSGGQTMKDTCYHERTQVRMRPDFDAMGAFKPVFPNGIRVYSSDFGTAEFVWKDGKPVPAVGGGTIGEMRGGK